MSGITTEEWLAEWDRLQAQQPQSEGMTRNELQAMWGCSQDTARRRLRMLMDAGKLKPGRASRMSIAGSMALVPVYSLVSQPKKKR